LVTGLEYEEPDQGKYANCQGATGKLKASGSWKFIRTSFHSGIWWGVFMLTNFAAIGLFPLRQSSLMRLRFGPGCIRWGVFMLTRFAAIGLFLLGQSSP
jgi:hypothetical protein